MTGNDRAAFDVEAGSVTVNVTAPTAYGGRTGGTVVEVVVVDPVVDVVGAVGAWLRSPTTITTAATSSPMAAPARWRRTLARRPCRGAGIGVNLPAWLGDLEAPLGVEFAIAATYASPRGQSANVP